MIQKILISALIIGFETSYSYAQSMSKKYRTVIAEQQINATPERVWEAMVLDYGEISNFSPYIYSSNYESGSLKGEAGAERKCSFNEKGSRWTHEKIVEIDHDNMIMKNIVIDAEKFPLNKDNSFAYYKVRDNGDGTTTASYEFRYRTQPGFMTGMVKGNFQKTLDETLLGLKHYLETGEKINASSGNWKEIKKQYDSNN